MNVRIFNLPLDPGTGTFIEEDLNAFLEQKAVIRMEPAFFLRGSIPCWSVWVAYEDVLEDHEKKRIQQAMPELSPPQKQLLERLFAARKELAKEEGIPVFIIASNRQLAQVAKKMPGTLEALKEINGFGGKKIKKYGRQIIDIVKIFKPVEEEARKGESHGQ